MKKIWHIALIDFKVLFKDKMFFFWLVVFPMLFIIIFGSLFKGGQGNTKAALMIMNKDKGKWGAYFIEKIQSPGLEIKLIEKEPQEYSRILILPEDFSTKIETKTAQELTLLKRSDSNMNAGQLVQTKIIQGIVKIITEMILYGNKDMKSFFTEKPEFKNILEIKTQFPEGTITKIPSGFDHIIPGIIVQFIMMMVMLTGGATVMEDRKKGVLSRILFSSASFGQLFGGKFLGRLLLGIFQASILIIAGTILFRLNLGNYLLAFLNILCFSMAMACLGIFMGSIFNKEEIIVGVSVLVANICAGLGGSWWPIEIVPNTFKTIGMISPSYWAMDTFHKIIFFKKGFEDVALNFVVLLGFTAVFMVLAVKFFKIKD